MNLSSTEQGIEERGLTRELEIQNPNGFHARPAAMFVKKAMKFEAAITVAKDGAEVSGKSIMSLMTLEAHRGTKISVTAVGSDAGDALDALEALVNNGFDVEDND